MSAIRRLTVSPGCALRVAHHPGRNFEGSPRRNRLIHYYTDRFWGVQTVLSQYSLNFGPFTRVTTLVSFPLLSTV